MGVRERSWGEVRTCGGVWVGNVDAVGIGARIVGAGIGAAWIGTEVSGIGAAWVGTAVAGIGAVAIAGIGAVAMAAWISDVASVAGRAGVTAGSGGRAASSCASRFARAATFG